MRSKEGFKNDLCGVMLTTSFAISSKGLPLEILKGQPTYDEIRAMRGQTKTGMQGINKTIPKGSKRFIVGPKHSKDANHFVAILMIKSFM